MAKQKSLCTATRNSGSFEHIEIGTYGSAGDKMFGGEIHIVTAIEQEVEVIGKRDRSESDSVRDLVRKETYDVV